MNKKILIQFTLGLAVMTFILIFFFYFYQKDNKNIISNSALNKTNIAVEDSEKSEILDNIMKDIKYLSKDIDGNIYEIVAKSGQIDQENPNLIMMKSVMAKITSKNYDDIYLKADSAIYNNESYDTNFINNVFIDFVNHKVKSDKVDLLFTEEIAIIYGNIIYSNLNTKLLADIIELDMITKNLEISMNQNNKKVKVIYKN